MLLQWTLKNVVYFHHREIFASLNFSVIYQKGYNPNPDSNNIFHSHPIQFWYVYPGKFSREGLSNNMNLMQLLPETQSSTHQDYSKQWDCYSYISRQHGQRSALTSWKGWAILFLILGPLIEVNSSQSMIRLLMHANLQGMMHLIILHLSKL